ncbi:hypothetical protein BDY21DRAFT_365867 [Lineolata rhizophorae]|uniref:non-specific serine/threonine protein kinase n=1 Tax=Lineolata rhizophorae TaxID=578093 RepID=A0A6A6NTT2_9PEZI|nr:hypothetical protein BDY21DRAFT_365867 [Lineolata rhizophorae]
MPPPRRRPPGAASAAAAGFGPRSLLLALLLAGPLVATAQQQHRNNEVRPGEPSHGSPSASTNDPFDYAAINHASTGAAVVIDGDDNADTVRYAQQHGINNHPHTQHKYDESALATLAPADSDPAVVAPPVVRPAAGEVPHPHDYYYQQQQQYYAEGAAAAAANNNYDYNGGGISSRPRARSLQDWEVEDFVLLATVDGTIHAHDRNTGEARWALEVDRPMVETTYFHHAKNGSSHDGNNSSRSDLDADGDAPAAEDREFPEEQILWIVEPSQDGALYVYTPGPRGGIQKLGLTVKRLAEELAPYAGDDPPVVYTAEKKNTLYTVDAGTGKILKIFSSGGSSVVDEGSCRRVSGFELDGEECESSGTLTLGRVEYTIGIQNKETSEPICTIKYFEWSPNNRDRDLHSQYFNTMDNKYIYSKHDGGILAIDHTQTGKIYPNQRVYGRKFPSPVARVYDIARPYLKDQSSRDTNLVILPQPLGPRIAGPAESETLNQKLFVNSTESGSWYAMSELSYPTVTDGASKARCYSPDWQREQLSLGPTQQHQPPHLRTELIGVHSLVSSPGDQRIHAMPAISPPQDGYPRYHEPINAIDESVHPSQVLDGISNATPRRSSIPAPPLTIEAGPHPASWASSAFSFRSLALLLVLALVGFASQDPRVKQPSLDFIRRNSVTWLSPVPSSPLSQQVSQEYQGEQIPAVAQDNPIPPEAGEHMEEKRVRFMPPGDPGTIPAVAGESIVPSRAAAASVDGVPGASGSAAAATGEPPAGDAAPGSASAQATDGQEAPQGETPKPKKKVHRGQRGGRKKRLKRAESNNSDEENVRQIVEGIKQIGNEAAGIQPDEITASQGPQGMQDVSDMVQINNLLIQTDRVLGYGSGGTTVYEGKFEGRDVAVKRMLPQYFDLALQEVSLLQQSDDHPNVIRYFCHQRDQNFLYIAVEKCQASLWDLYSRSSMAGVGMGLGAGAAVTRSSELEGELTEAQTRLVTEINLDVPRALYQLAAGLNHLHNLRIIHRDIKPQNILVAYPKKNQQGTGPRFVISDFGLCKTLPDNASTLVGTTGNAGTIGWKAPELIMQPKDAADRQSSGGSGGQNKGEGGSASSATSEAVAQGVKRAVDIFSLGCVFFYVLTNGNHPFDDNEGWMQIRELNIKKDRKNLAKLRDLGDSDVEEPMHLLSAMLSNQPQLRPTAAQVMHHPFFWSPDKRLTFLCDVSDHMEREPRDPPSAQLQLLESHAPAVIRRGDFLALLDRRFVDTLGKQRKYTGGRMLDLLRALRNKKNHYEDMPEDVKARVGELPKGYLGYWTVRFPRLVMACYETVVDCGLQRESRFRVYFGEE